MRKTGLLFITFILIASFGYAQEIDRPFQVYHPEIMAQGGSFTAVSHGYGALFTNPAGFAREGGSFTLLSAKASGWGSISDFMDLWGYYEDGTFDDTDLLLQNEAVVNHLQDMLLEKGVGAGLGVGGIGIVGNGLGIGLISDIDMYGHERDPEDLIDPTLTALKMEGSWTTALVAGLAMELKPLGFPIYLGADIRPMYRMKGDLQFLKIIQATSGNGGDALEGTELSSGFGIAIDGGAIAELGPFTVGMSLRDLFGTTMYYDHAMVGGETLGSSEELIPMQLALGASFHPNLGGLAQFVDPMIHAEYNTVLDKSNEKSFLTQTHFGTEIEVLKFLPLMEYNLRAGLNGGNPSFGVGAKVLFVDINFAAFSIEKGNYAAMGDRKTGYSLEVAVRF